MVRRELDDKGKVPFALVGVVLIILSSMAFAMVGEINQTERDTSIYTPTRETSAAAGEAQSDFKNRAYHTVLQEIHNLTKKRDPDMTTLQGRVEDSLESYINDTYPLRTKNCIVYMDNWSANIISDMRSTLEIHENFYSQAESIEPFQASSLQEVDQANSTEFEDGRAPFYGKVLGRLEMSVLSEASGKNITYNKEFNKDVYSPVFYLRSRFSEFRGESNSSFGEVGKLIRYQLSTITQVRTLFGNASGGYGENEGDIESLLSKEDVEVAVNLALLLEAVRLYGDYDEDFAAEMGVESELEDYAQNGTIDAADIFLMHRDIKDQDVDAGKVLAQAIYPFGEDFVLDLYELFWGDEIVDPTLSEPVVDWEEMEDKGEDWAEEQVRTWLDVYREWLGIPEKLDAQEESATIRKMEGDQSPYQWECLQNPEAPRPVGGHYWVFSQGPSIFEDGTWYMESEEVSDTIDLILGDPDNENNDPEPYVLHFDDDFQNDISERTIEYYLVEESLIQKHAPDSDQPYFETLKDILQTINRSMRQRSEDIEDVEEKGFMDTISNDIADTIGTKDANFQTKPEDNRSVMINGTEYMVENEDGSIRKGLNEFRDDADDFDNRDEWWSEGAYKREYEDSNFIYHLTKETVDLWYEAVVNLYDGGVKESGRNPGSLSTDPPEEEQHSEGDSSEGSFAFRQDAMKDVNERVRDIAIPRRTRPIKIEAAWETTIGEPCWYSCERCTTYRTVTIPNDAQSTWTDQAIWDRLWEDIEDTTDQVVGEQGLLSDDQISQDLKEDMDETTDVGEYEGERSGEGDYYDFILDRIAVRTIGDDNGKENMLLNLSQENGWLQQKFNRTLRDIHRNTHVNQEETFLATNMSQPRYNWRMNRSYDRERQRVLNETFTVEFSDYLEKEEDLSIDIQYPEKGQHFVDVQGRYADEGEERTNMSWSSFQTALNVSIEGSLEVNTTTDRRNIPVGVHKSTWYNGTVGLNYNYSLPLHSAQPLESGWQTDDVDYEMTRSYFNLIEEESIDSDKPLIEDAIYISRPFMNLSRAMTDVLTRSTNSLDSFQSNLRDLPHSTLSKPLQTSRNLTRLMKTIDDISYDTYNDTAYFDFIDEQKEIISEDLPTHMDVLDYPYMGFDLEYNVQQDTIEPLYENNGTEISFTLGDEDFSYTAEQFGSSEITLTVDPSKEDRVVVTGWKNTTADNYSFDLRFPPESTSIDEINLNSIGSDLFSNITLPNLGENYTVGVGLKTTEEELPSEVEDWFETAVEKRNDSYEGFIRLSKKLLKEMHEDPEVVEELEKLGFYIDIDGDIEHRSIYWTNRTDTSEIREFSRLLINDIRGIGRNLGALNPAPSIYSRANRDMLNNYSFEILGDRGNFTRGNLGWWASAEPSIGRGRGADYLVGEVGLASLQEEKSYKKYAAISCRRS